MSKVFCYLQIRECGCCCHVTSPEALPHAMKDKSFKKAMLAGEILSLRNREEYDAIPWQCEKCMPKKKAENTTLFSTE